MILDSFPPSFLAESFDLWVIGSGPAGLACAIAACERGLKVAVIESGPVHGLHLSPEAYVGHNVPHSVHARLDVAMCRALGGTSKWWGGRCVPFDDVDFEERRTMADWAWPISHAEISRFYNHASDFFGVERGDFAATNIAWANLGRVSADRLERWTPEIDMSRRHLEYLKDSERIVVVCNSTVVELPFDASDSAIRSMRVLVGDQLHEIAVTQVVVAAGGLESTRLLLASEPIRTRLNPEVLGHGYMGHLSGKIADIVFNSPHEVSAFDFFREPRSYARRRLTLKNEVMVQEDLVNVAFWVDNPPFADHRHASGVLSMVWLALSIPFIGRRLVSEGVRISHVGTGPHRWGAHVLNVVRSPLRTLLELTRIVRVRFLQKPAMPGFLVRNASGRYALHAHAEQSPRVESHVALNDALDPYGVPCLDIQLKFAESDAARLVRAHEVLDEELQRTGKGRLEFYDQERESRVKRLLDNASDGFHQIGTTRMGVDPSASVVDANCRVHGVSNLYVASSSVFPTSGQANPTFLAVALAIRLAEHLANIRNTRKPFGKAAA